MASCVMGPIEDESCSWERTVGICGPSAMQCTSTTHTLRSSPARLMAGRGLAGGGGCCCCCSCCMAVARAVAAEAIRGMRPGAHSKTQNTGSILGVGRRWAEVQVGAVTPRARAGRWSGVGRGRGEKGLCSQTRRRFRTACWPQRQATRTLDKYRLLETWGLRHPECTQDPEETLLSVRSVRPGSKMCCAATACSAKPNGISEIAYISGTEGFWLHHA